MNFHPSFSNSLRSLALNLLSSIVVFYPQWQVAGGSLYLVDISTEPIILTVEYSPSACLVFQGEPPPHLPLIVNFSRPIMDGSLRNQAQRLHKKRLERFPESILSAARSEAQCLTKLEWQTVDCIFVSHQFATSCGNS